LGLHVLSSKEMKSLLNDTIGFEKVNGEVKPKDKEKRYTLTASNFYAPRHLASITAASASMKSPVIAEISYGSMKLFANSGNMEDGAALIKAYFEVMQERDNPLVIGDTEVDLNDAAVGIMVDHHKFVDYLKKAEGSTEDEKYENAKQKFLSDMEATFKMGGDVFSLHMVDAAEGTTYEQNVNISQSSLKLAKTYGKVMELEYSATGGLGEEGTGKHAADMSEEEYAEYIKEIYQFIEDVTQDIGNENLAAIAFDFGTEHVARKGEVLIPKYKLLEQYQKEGLKTGTGTYGVVGHGGTSLGTEEIMNNLRGLLGKVNKATQLKRRDLEYLVNYIDDNRALINANLRGDTEEEASLRLDREITKKQIDDTHHPKYTIYGPQAIYMETVQWYMECLGSKGILPDLYERGILQS